MDKDRWTYSSDDDDDDDDDVYNGRLARLGRLVQRPKVDIIRQNHVSLVQAQWHSYATCLGECEFA